MRADPADRTLLMRLLVIALFASLTLGCRRSPGHDDRAAETSEQDASIGAQPTGPLSSAKGAPRPARCVALAGAPALSVGAQGVAAEGDDEEDEPRPLSGGAVEFARGAADGDTFLLGLLHQKEETRALVAFLDPGAARLLDLGRVDQHAEPPRVAAQAGIWLALVTDVGPSGPSLRLVGLSKNGSQIESRLGPEVRKGKRDPADADVAVLAGGRAVVVWDRETSSGHSEIAGLALDARSLREQGPPLVLTPPEQNALEPRIVAGAAGFWLLWLVEERGRAESEPAVDAGLLLEPPRVLFVRELDGAGRPRGAPTAINPGRPAPLLVDARVLSSGQLLVVHRSAPADRPTDDQPLQLSIVSPGGGVQGYPLDLPEVAGPGAPTVLGRAGVDASWVPLEDANGTTGLLRLSADGSVETTPLGGLGGQIALAGDPGRLLTAEPRGIGVELQIQTCLPN